MTLPSSRRHLARPPQVKHVVEEEWSYIPVGGPLPLPDQPVVAFGAAAGLVHPATGYSLTRSLREAPGMADAIAAALHEAPGSTAANAAWEALWSQERRRQAAFHVFGMELLCQVGWRRRRCPHERDRSRSLMQSTCMSPTLG